MLLLGKAAPAGMRPGRRMIIVNNQMQAEKKSRNAVIVRTSIIGILANVFLAAFKAVVGFASNSIAIVMDAVNNISDAASSVITIIGAKLAGKEPDRKHPFGYGRIEYLSTMIISLIILYAGITAFVESVKKIINPDVPEYSAVTIIIVAVALVVKIFLGRYVKRTGEKVHSDALVNSGEEATLDSVISASTLVAAAVFMIFGLSLEAWLGAVIALVIIKSGIEMLRDALSQILGQRADAQLARDIKNTISRHQEISGVYDLILNDYGPDAWNGSVHIEVADTMTADELDQLIRKVTEEVHQQHGVILTAVGVYSMNTKDPEAVTAREQVREIITGFPEILQMHGFYMDQAGKTIRFDIVISFDAKDRGEVYRKVCEQVQEIFPDYSLQITMDTDFSEE